MATTSQWFVRHATPSTTTTRFNHLSNGNQINGQLTENFVSAPFTSAGNLVTFTVTLSVAPGVGKSWQFWISINGTPNGTLTVTIADAATTATATGVVAVAAGDLVAIKGVPTGTPAATDAQMSTEFVPTVANNFTYPATYGEGSVTGTSPGYNRLLFGTNVGKGTESLANSTRDIAPFAGTITAFYLALSAAPGSGKSWDFAVMINGVEVAATDINIADLATTGNLTGLSVAVAAGDQLTFFIKSANGTPANTRIKWGVTLVNSAGMFAMGVAGSTSRTSSAFYSPTGTLANESITESVVQLVTAPAALRIFSIYAGIGAAPGAGKSWTVQNRVANNNGQLSFVMDNATSGGVVGSNSGNTDLLAAGDLLDLSFVETGAAPTGTSGQAFGFGMKTDTALGGGSTGGKSKGGGKGGGHGTTNPPGKLKTFGVGHWRWGQSRWF